MGRVSRLFLSVRGAQTLLVRLSILLRNTLATCSPLITPGKCWHKITWPEFRPSLPPGQGLPIQMDPSSIPSYSFHGAHMDITTCLTAHEPSSTICSGLIN